MSAPQSKLYVALVAKAELRPLFRDRYPSVFIVGDLLTVLIGFVNDLSVRAANLAVKWHKVILPELGRRREIKALSQKRAREDSASIAFLQLGIYRDRRGDRADKPL